MEYEYIEIKDKNRYFSIEELKKNLVIKGYCPHCIYNMGRLEQRNGKKGRFIGCSNYPECKYAQFEKN